MKYNILFFVFLIIATFNAINAIIRNTNNANNLTPGDNNNQYDSQNDTNNLQNVNKENPFNKNDSCEIQKIAEETMANLLNEKDVFTYIMESLQNRMNGDYLCSEQKYSSICLQNKDNHPLDLPCTSTKYETLIHKFTYRKLCHSKIAFSNALLKPFIEKNEAENTFNIILKRFNLLLNCIDDDLKQIYLESIKLFTDLKILITEMSEKMWPKAVIDVLKKREHFIAGIFCELRKGNNSSLVSNSLEFENLGILKLNDENILNEAVYAFSEYYYNFPYFTKKLLEKGGLVEKLITIHEKLTSYRTQHILTKINEHSKNEVLNSDEVLTNFSNYKQHHNHNVQSFIQADYVDISNLEEHISNLDNINSNDNVNTNHKSDFSSNGIQNISLPPNVNNNLSTAEPKETLNTIGINNNEQPTQKNNNNNVSHINHDNENIDNATLRSPLSSINTLQSKNIVDLIKSLIKDTNIVKFENDEPTNYIDDEGIKKLITTYFNDLNDSIMLVRLIMKPQVVILSVIQSFILMTPSPKEDAKNYCNKALVNEQLIDATENSPSEEENLINSFANKYNLIYEKIKLEELKDIELNKKVFQRPKLNLSVIQMQNLQDTNQQATNKQVINQQTMGQSTIDQQNMNQQTINSQDENSQDGNSQGDESKLVKEPNSSVLLILLNDPNGQTVDAIIENNVDLAVLGSDVDQAFRNPNSAILYSQLSYVFAVLFFLFYII